MCTSTSTRKVQFTQAKHKVRPIPALSTFSADDIDAIWYNKYEVDTIVELANELVLKAEDSPEGTSVIRDFEGDALRGLERKTQDGHTEAFLSRVGVYDAVLDEQDKQWAKSKNDLDMEKIATLSLEASKQAKEAAQTRAKQDEADVQVYLHVEGPFLPVPKDLKEDSQTSGESSSEEETELDLEQVFSKSSPSLSSHFSKERKGDDSWITRGTSSTSSFSSWDLDSDSEHSTSSNSHARQAKRASLTNAKKVTTPAVPRPSTKAKAQKKNRRLPSRKHNASFAKSNEPAMKEAMQLPVSPRRASPRKAPKKTASVKRLSLECSAFL